jgi:hypothetical protein
MLKLRRMGGTSAYLTNAGLKTSPVLAPNRSTLSVLWGKDSDGTRVGEVYLIWTGR